MPDLPMFARSIFDRAAHHRTDRAWLDQAWARSRVLLVSKESTTPVYQGGAGMRVSFAAPSGVTADAERFFLGVHDDVVYFAAVGKQDDGWQGIRQIGPAGDELELDLLVTAVALSQWHLRHGRCALCGEATVIEQAGWTRRCPIDASEHFPRTDPAVIMLVHDGDRCLLGRGAAWGAGRFSTLAGFVEPGESLEAAVIREVFEECGAVVTDVRYLASQPWPFPSSLMLGFSARGDSSAAVTPDNVEMLEAGWFSRDEVAQAADWTDHEVQPGDPDSILRGIPPRLSISRYLIDEWLAGRS